MYYVYATKIFYGRFQLQIKICNMAARTSWEILNSNFVVWAMGVLALSLIPFIYDGCKQSRESERHRERLYYEVKSRFAQIFLWLRRGADSSGRAVSLIEHTPSKINVHEVMYGFLDPPSETFRPKYRATYEEFADLSILSVLNTLMELENNEKRREAIRKTTSSLVRVENIPTVELIDIDSIDTVIKNIKEDILVEQWKTEY